MAQAAPGGVLDEDEGSGRDNGPQRVSQQRPALNFTGSRLADDMQGRSSSLAASENHPSTSMPNAAASSTSEDDAGAPMDHMDNTLRPPHANENRGALASCIISDADKTLKRSLTNKAGGSASMSITNFQTTVTTIRCPICLDRERNTVLIPCGHLTCTLCSHQITQCPICRKDIHRSTHVYL
ncbi:hypothetical protein CYMTET_9058 [Cymbomonas tetramitiformis]|uniref:RING-type domain-containing protein n=1 Tax=Cymbomonas tetramitiformis TaxID=36881 RepID=A0AAE0GS44_9CHLO|nr:hypothetical protein CYMTET_9058 [Cymbomonas tetramitiformis]